jgi:hypothetical protein
MIEQEPATPRQPDAVRAETARAATARVHPKLAKEMKKHQQRRADVTAAVAGNQLRGVAEQALVTAQQSTRLLAAVLFRELELAKVEAPGGSLLVVYTPEGQDLHDEVVDQLRGLLKLPVLVLAAGTRLDAVDAGCMAAAGWTKGAVDGPSEPKV